MQHLTTSPESITLNIGLLIGRGPEANTVTQTVQAIERTGLIVEHLRVVHSDTEPTVVVQVRVPTAHWGPRTVHETIHGLAVTLGQQAIAAHGYLVGWGRNIGPDAAAWGEFDPELFWTLEGRRMAERAPSRPAWAGATRDQSEDRGQPFTLEQLAALGRRSVGDPVPAWLAGA